MLVEHDKKAIEKGLLTVWIMWAAIMGTLFIYVFICHQFGDEIRRNMSQNAPIPLLRNIFYGIAVITLFLSHFLKRYMLSGTSGGSLSKSAISGLRQNQPTVLAKYTNVLIVSLALSEGIGIYGFVLFLLGDSFQTFYIFIGISALAIYLHRPRREELERLARAMQTEEATSAEL